MSFKSLGASALFRVLAAGAALTGVVAVSAPAFANTASVDQAQAGQLSAQIVAAVKAAQLSADCQNKVDVKAQQACQASIELAIQNAIMTSGASPFVAQAALAQAQTQLVADGSFSGATAMAVASVSGVVNQQASATGATIGGGAPAGPATSNSISSPPSSSGGGGYVTH